MNPAWVREKWGAVMKIVTNFCVSHKTRIFLSCWVILGDFGGF